MCNSCTDLTPSTAYIASETSSTEMPDGTACKSMNDALLTRLKLNTASLRTNHLPSGNADENMMTVISRLMMGSK